MSEQVFKRYGDNLTNLLLGFSLSSGIPCVLTGVKTMEELEQNVPIANSYIPFSESEIESIIGMLEDNSMKDSNFCHWCGYCMDCPSHINISYILRLDEYFQRFGATKMVTGTYRDLLNSMNQCTQCGLCEKNARLSCP